MDIAVLGMGRMGQAVATRLLGTGHAVTIWNRTPGRAPDLVSAGATEVGTIAEAVTGVRLVITSLANDDAVREVALDGLGVAASIADGTAYVDASTVSPELARVLSEEIPGFASMPIMGSPMAVESGKAGYLLGGTGGAADVVGEVLPDLTSVVKRYPEPPLASAAKLCVNLLLLDAVVALAESFAVGRAGGLTEDQLRDLLADSAVVPAGLANRFEGVLTGDQDPWWTNALGAKDAGLALGLVARAGRTLPLTAAAREQYLAAAQSEPDDADIATVTNRYRPAG